MATTDAVDLNTRNTMQNSPYGNAAIHSGSVAATAGANGDIYRAVRIPAGTRVDQVFVSNDDLDSNGAPAIANKVGYTPVNSADGPAANDAYFAAAGQTWFQAAGHRGCNFAPILFDYDVYIIVTLTAAAATFAAGNVRVTALGENVGTK